MGEQESEGGVYVSLLSAKSCVICEKPMRLGAHKIADGALCGECYKKAGYDLNTNVPVKNKSAGDVRKDMAAMEANAARLAAFEVSRKIGNHLAIDEGKRQWVLPDGPRGRLVRARVYNFDDIVEYELLEDGDAIVKSGLGRAIIGAALFGGVGAIVGGITGKKNKPVVDSLKVRIVVRNMTRPTEYITLISARTKANSLIHKAALQEAREILSSLALMAEKD